MMKSLMVAALVLFSAGMLGKAFGKVVMGTSHNVETVIRNVQGGR